jgi:hypothetical protein
MSYKLEDTNLRLCILAMFGYKYLLEWLLLLTLYIAIISSVQYIVTLTAKIHASCSDFRGNLKIVYYN